MIRTAGTQLRYNKAIWLGPHTGAHNFILPVESGINTPREDGNTGNILILENISHCNLSENYLWVC